MLTLVGTPLEQESWENTLRRESRPGDLYEDYEGVFQDNKQSLPDGIIATVNLAPSVFKKTIGILLDIGGEGVVGREDPLNKEQDQQVKEYQVFANDVGQMINTSRYGIDAHSKEAYGLLPLTQPQISLWHKQVDGRAIRESLLERYSRNIIVAPTSRVQRWNENIFIKGVTFAAQPVYDSTNATYEANICNAATAGTGGQWDVPFLNAANYWVTTLKYLMPMDNGRYPVTVPSRQAMFLKDPSAALSIAGLFRDSKVEEAGKNAYKYYLGSYGKLDLFEDALSPVVNVNGTSLTSYYRNPGNKSDDRYTAGSGTDYDVGIVHGKASTTKAIYEQLHFEEEIQKYGKVIGVGGFTGYGYNRTVFDDVGAETDTSQINQNSAVLLARTSLAAV